MQEKLKTLKAITPSEKSLQRIRATIDARIHTTDVATPTPSPYVKPVEARRYALYGAVASLALVLIVAVNSQTVEHKVLATRVALSSNAHNGSILAINALEDKSTIPPSLLNDERLYDGVVDTLDLTKNTLDTLKLMGEKGKYTQEECLGDYKRYSVVLDALDKSIDKLPAPTTEDGKKKLELLKQKLYDAQEEAEARIGKYPVKN